jgi:hypothetical protein
MSASIELCGISGFCPSLGETAGTFRDLGDVEVEEVAKKDGE